jgi:SAM-dependent methyltransferase
MTPGAPLAVPREFHRGLHETRTEWLESGRFTVDLLCQTLGREELAEVELLDVGCGTKIVKTLHDEAVPIGRYVGVDVDPAVIEWLRANVTDSRFEFHQLNAHNERYNPNGQDLASFDQLPVGPRQFDLICLFSVFTHLAPHDYVAMLRLLRRHAKPDGRLLFSLFVDDAEQASPKDAETVAKRLASDDPRVRERAEAAIARAMARRGQPGYRFVDEIPESPLKVARYEKDYALELVGGTGWEVVALHPPGRFIQHYMVCRPV